jgi:ArsR family transcriptional regulator
MREMVRISKALSDETRIRMLKLLLDKDICVCEMEKIFPLSESQLSRHLKILMEAGFLKRWRDGKCIVYVADKKDSNRYCRAVIELLSDSYNDQKVVLEDREKLRQVIADHVREHKR